MDRCGSSQGGKQAGLDAGPGRGGCSTPNKICAALGAPTSWTRRWPRPWRLLDAQQDLCVPPSNTVGLPVPPPQHPVPSAKAVLQGHHPLEQDTSFTTEKEIRDRDGGGKRQVMVVNVVSHGHTGSFKRGAISIMSTGPFDGLVRPASSATRWAAAGRAVP